LPGSVTVNIALVSALMSVEALAVRDFAERLPFFFVVFVQAERVTLCVLAFEVGPPDPAVVAPCAAPCVLAGLALRPDVLAPVPVMPAPSADAPLLVCAAAGLAAVPAVAGGVVPGSGVVDGVTDVDGLALSLGEAEALVDGVEAPVEGWPALNLPAAGEHVLLGDAPAPGLVVGEPLPSTEGPRFAPGALECAFPPVELPLAPESLRPRMDLGASPR
jgi:hypothetical protein